MTKWLLIGIITLIYILFLIFRKKDKTVNASGWNFGDIGGCFYIMVATIIYLTLCLVWAIIF